MIQNRCMQRVLSGIMILAFSLISLFVAPVQAGMVQTADILATQDSHGDRQTVSDFMERKDVARQLQDWGVDVDEAKARVASLSDEEIQMLAQHIDQLPAGGDSFIGFLLGLAIITFVILIFTDLAGVTDVFTFIKKK
jgi:hypothetical protein